jgi:hypothetical protein
VIQRTRGDPRHAARTVRAAYAAPLAAEDWLAMAALAKEQAHEGSLQDVGGREGIELVLDDLWRLGSASGLPASYAHEDFPVA